MMQQFLFCEMLWNDEKSDRLLSSVLFRYLKWNRVRESKGCGIICRECLLKDAEDVFYAEQNDTIFHYLKTRPCGRCILLVLVYMEIRYSLELKT